MSEKKGVREFLKKTFELKKKTETEEAEKVPAKKTPAASKTTKAAAKPAPKKTAVNPPAKSVSKATPAKTTPKSTPRTAQAKPAASKNSKTTPTKTAAAKTTVSETTAPKTPATKKTVPVKPASAKPAASKTTASKETAGTAAKKPVEFSKNMTKADNVRFYIYRTYFKPAKLKGQNKITLVSGDVHTDMGLKSEMPTVAAAMKTRIDRLYDVEILDVKPPGAANSKLTVKYDLRNLYMEEESIKPVTEKIENLASERTGKGTPDAAIDAESSYLILKELEEKLRQFVSDRVVARFGKEWWKGTDMSFLADRWNERRIMNDRTVADKRGGRNEQLINYASFSDYRRIINNPFAWDAFEEYFPDRSWIIQRLKELDPIRNAIMHHTPLEEDDYTRLGLYARDILKIIDTPADSKSKKKTV